MHKASVVFVPSNILWFLAQLQEVFTKIGTNLLYPRHYSLSSSYFLPYTTIHLSKWFLLLDYKLFKFKVHVLFKHSSIHWISQVLSTFLCPINLHVYTVNERLRGTLKISLKILKYIFKFKLAFNRDTLKSMSPKFELGLIFFSVLI